MTLQFLNQIYVYDIATISPTAEPLYTCDTLAEASSWIEQHGDTDKYEYSIDGTPEAWHEQTGECGGSSICDCGDNP